MALWDRINSRFHPMAEWSQHPDWEISGFPTCNAASLPVSHSTRRTKPFPFGRRTEIDSFLFRIEEAKEAFTKKRHTLGLTRNCFLWLRIWNRLSRGPRT